MKKNLLCVLFISLAFIGSLAIVCNAYELSDPDAQAMARLIKGDINSITIVGKQTWDVERLFIAVAQSISGVKQVSTLPTTETRMELRRRPSENGKGEWYEEPTEINGYIGYVSTKPLGLFWKHKAFMMLPSINKRGVDVYRTEIEE